MTWPLLIDWLYSWSQSHREESLQLADLDSTRALMITMAKTSPDFQTNKKCAMVYKPTLEKKLRRMDAQNSNMIVSSLRSTNILVCSSSDNTRSSSNHSNSALARLQTLPHDQLRRCSGCEPLFLSTAVAQIPLSFRSHAKNT